MFKHGKVRLASFVYLSLLLGSCQQAGLSIAESSLLRVQTGKEQGIKLELLVGRLTNKGEEHSLNWAIDQANRHQGASEITFSPGLMGEIKVNELMIRGAVTIHGPGEQLILSGSRQHQVLHVLPQGHLTLSGVTITDGQTTEFGGGLLNEGTADISEVTFNKCIAFKGGAIANLSQLTLTKCKIQDNIAIQGAGIRNAHDRIKTDEKANMTITDCQICSNHAYASENIKSKIGKDLFKRKKADKLFGSAGGIDNKADMTINTSTIKNNYANFDGGGIGNLGTLRIENTNILNNHSNSGGGLANNSCLEKNRLGKLILIKCALRENQAEIGGSIKNSGNILISGGEITKNEAKECGGGIANYGTLKLERVSIQGNRAKGGGGLHNDYQGKNKLPDVTIIDCRFIANESTFGGGIANSSNIVIVGGQVSKNKAEENGGGITNNGTLRLEQVNIQGNRAKGGGGLSNDYEGKSKLPDVTIIDCRFITNESNFGGGISNGGNIFITGGEVSDNKTEEEGGGITNNGTLRLERVSIKGNKAKGGGGLHNSYQGKNTLPDITIIDSRFVSNEAEYGGGIRNSGNMVITGGEISDNKAEGYGGGGITNNGTLRLEQVNVQSNKAKYGGGICNECKGKNTLPDIIIIDSRFVGNEAEYGGGIKNSGRIKIAGGQFSNNKADKDGGGIINDGTLRLERVNIQANKAKDGGGLRNEYQGKNTLPDIIIIDSRFIDNKAEYGGAIKNSSKMSICGGQFTNNKVGNTDQDIKNDGQLTIEPEKLKRCLKISSKG